MTRPEEGMPIIITIEQECHFLKGIVSTHWNGEIIGHPGIFITADADKNQKIACLKGSIRMTEEIEGSFQLEGKIIEESIRKAACLAICVVDVSHILDLYIYI